MSKVQLAIVIPVYNESEAIEIVIADWCKTLSPLGVNYELHIYNDGSKDNTLTILNSLRPKYERLIVHDKPNSGHGPTVLLGYKQNVTRAEWLFQVDSDNEMTAENFPKLWAVREQFDFIVGDRIGRKSPLPRLVVTTVSRIAVKLLYSWRTIKDVNTPYRLMRCSAFAPIVEKIPDNTFAPNVIISGMAGLRNLRYHELPVPYRFRETGVVSIKKWKLFKAAAKSLRQTVEFRFL